MGLRVCVCVCVNPPVIVCVHSCVCVHCPVIVNIYVCACLREYVCIVVCVQLVSECPDNQRGTWHSVPSYVCLRTAL